MFPVKHNSQPKTEVFKSNSYKSKSFGEKFKGGNFFDAQLSECFLSIQFKSKFSSYQKFIEFNNLKVSHAVKCISIWRLGYKQLKWHTYKQEEKTLITKIKSFFGYKLKSTRKLHDVKVFKIGAIKSFVFGFKF